MTSLLFLNKKNIKRRIFSILSTLTFIGVFLSILFANSVNAESNQFTIVDPMCGSWDATIIDCLMGQFVQLLPVLHVLLILLSMITIAPIVSIWIFMNSKKRYIGLLSPIVWSIASFVIVTFLGIFGAIIIIIIYLFARPKEQRNDNKPTSSSTDS